MATLVETRDLLADFHTFEGVVKALNSVGIVVRQGETYGLVGESGCGKSVTVRSIMRIVQSPGKIVGGSIVLFASADAQRQGIELLDRSDTYMTSVRGSQISMIFQEPSTSLNPVLSIGDQIGESLYFHRRDAMIQETLTALDREIADARTPFGRLGKSVSRSLFRKELAVLEKYQADVEWTDSELARIEHKEDEEAKKTRAYLNRHRDGLRAHSVWIKLARRVPVLKRYYKRLDATIRTHVVALLRELGVPNPERIASGYPHELSGGMQQRIVIAIALACHPILLIADEPTSNLDVTIQAQILDLIKHLKEKIISSVLFITHDLGLVAELCDRASVMYAGDVCETGKVEDLFRTPLHPYTQGLLESVPSAESRGELKTIAGVVPNLIDPPMGCRFHPRCPRVMEVCRTQKPLPLDYEEGHSVACHLYTKATP